MFSFGEGENIRKGNLTNTHKTWGSTSRSTPQVDVCIGKRNCWISFCFPRLAIKLISKKKGTNIKRKLKKEELASVIKKM